MKWKKTILLVVALAMVQVASAAMCEDRPEITQNCTMITPELDCAEHNYTIISATNGSVVETGNLTLLAEDVYYFNFTQGEGEYVVHLCDGAVREVVVEPDEGGKVIIAVIILLPMILGLFFMIGAASLNEQHAPLKIFLFLLSIVCFWAAMHLGLVGINKFYDFPILQETMGTTIYWTGITFFVIVSYFAIYMIYKAIQVAAQKKRERLNY